MFLRKLVELGRNKKRTAEVRGLLDELRAHSFDFDSRVKIRDAIASNKEKLAIALINALFEQSELSDYYSEAMLYDILYGAIDTPYKSVAQLALEKFTQKRDWDKIGVLVCETRFYDVARKGLDFLISHKEYDLLRRIKDTITYKGTVILSGHWKYDTFERLSEKERNTLTTKLFTAIDEYVAQETADLDWYIWICFEESKEKIMHFVSELARVKLIPEMNENKLWNFIVDYAHKALEEAPEYPDLILKDFCSGSIQNFITPLIKDKFFIYDTECIYDVEEDLSDIINLFLSHSGSELKGLTYKIDANENPDGDQDIIISFTYKGKRYSTAFEQVGDWETGEVLRLFNKVLEDIGSLKRFAEVSLYDDQCAYVIFATWPQIDVLKKIYKYVTVD